MIKHSKAVTDLLNRLSNEGFEEARELAASTCTRGHDNDGSTGLEIFQNGFDLGEKAKGRDVTFGVRAQVPSVCLFFTGGEEEALNRLKDLV